MMMMMASRARNTRHDQTSIPTRSSRSESRLLFEFLVRGINQFLVLSLKRILLFVIFTPGFRPTPQISPPHLGRNRFPTPFLPISGENVYTHLSSLQAARKRFTFLGTGPSSLSFGTKDFILVFLFSSEDFQLRETFEAIVKTVTGSTIVKRKIHDLQHVRKSTFRSHSHSLPTLGRASEKFQSDLPRSLGKTTKTEN